MIFFKHLYNLIKEVLQFAWKNKKWSLIPIFIAFLGIGLLIFAGETSAPFIYTLF